MSTPRNPPRLATVPEVSFFPSVTCPSSPPSLFCFPSLWSPACSPEPHINRTKQVFPLFCLASLSQRDDVRFFRVVVSAVLFPPCSAEPSARVSLSCGCSGRCVSPDLAPVQLCVGILGREGPGEVRSSGRPALGPASPKKAPQSPGQGSPPQGSELSAATYSLPVTHRRFGECQAKLGTGPCRGGCTSPAGV